MNKNNICNNCCKQGHQFYQCKQPITSYGIILFRNHPEKGVQYLMIRRKDSFGYIDFIRGKYTLNNLEHFEIMFNEMSIEERERILKYDFETLWKMLWNIKDNEQLTIFKAEETASNKKFYALKNGIEINDGEIINLESLILNAKTSWKETEWEFPKGRRNHQEKDLDCALREFEEETGINKKYVKIIENIMQFEEIFIGSNHKSYKHKYFLGYMEEILDIESNFQEGEVSKMEWKTIHECLVSIRTYNLDKRRLINNINKIIQDYVFC